ncbi:hypothetical protein CBP12_06950 [Oceanisphaera avium]|uniref:L,D-TPase catalytic domain-containing protein n=2 Tax=Oceanisphaera avium TaxID=1903694 RepID=A0A1Y0D1B7_9GAMM|nr:hypothetical protein CBP12_06950 [Oceanisphaera avium]
MPQGSLNAIPEQVQLEVELDALSVPSTVELTEEAWSEPHNELSELDFDIEEPELELPSRSQLSSPLPAPLMRDPQRYDEDLAAGVKRFQARHGLTVDGVIGAQTYAWLNTPPLQRAQLLMRSMLRTLIGDDLPSSYMLVNIPEYHLRLYQNQALVFESNVIVGQNKRKTPIMASKITSVVFNPPWNVPRSIINKDILPKLARDPYYLDRQGFEVLDNSGTHIIPREEWQTRFEEGGGFPYRLRQRPGRGNALGAYKFHLPNNDAIYLHDTPGRGLFARDSRAFSSGCVRVEGAEQLADWLLHDQLSSARLSALKANPETKWVKVKQALPLYMVYWPGWLGENGQPQFRNDIYGFDNGITSPFKAG